MQDPELAGEYATGAAEIVRELAHCLTLSNDPELRFKGRLSGNEKVAWAEPLPLEEVKAALKGHQHSEL